MHASPRPALARRLPASAIVVLLALIPLLSGCLTRSVNVGDQFSGFVVVAAAPGAVPAPPSFDVPVSMTGSVSVTPFPAADADRSDTTTSASGKTGSRLTFTHLTAGQFSQLGDIVSSGLDAGAQVDLSASRSGDVVRMRGGAALTGMPANVYYLSITVEFDGPVVATNGTQVGDSTVTWTPEPGQNTQFNADAQYADPATAALPGWTWFLVISCLIIAVVVGLLAYRNRDRTPRYRAPAAGAAPHAAAGVLHRATGRMRRLRGRDDDDSARSPHTDAAPGDTAVRIDDGDSASPSRTAPSSTDD